MWSFSFLFYSRFPPLLCFSRKQIPYFTQGRIQGGDLPGCETNFIKCFVEIVKIKERARTFLKKIINRRMERHETLRTSSEVISLVGEALAGDDCKWRTWIKRNNQENQSIFRCQCCTNIFNMFIVSLE